MKILFAAALLLPTGIQATAQTELRALLQERTGDSFWTRVNAPVAVGAPVRVTRFLNGDTVANGRVAWISTAPPYEVLISGIQVTKKYNDVFHYTSYERRFEDRNRSSNDLSEPICQGMYVAISRSSSAPLAFSGRVSEALVKDFMSRPEGKKFADAIDATDIQALAMAITSQRDRKFSDPIVSRLATRIVDLDMSLNPKGDRVPTDFFPPDLAKDKDGNNSQRTRTP